MGIFNFWRKKEKPQGVKPAPTNNGGKPFYTSFGENVYASDIIVQSIRCKANEFKKLDPRHIRTANGAQAVVNDSSIARVLKRPNPYMTTADFLEKITILLELNKNVFIYPTYYKTKGGEKFYTGLYPLKPSEVQYLTNDKDELFLSMRFANGYETTLPADSVIHWRKDYGVNDYFGGGMFGGNDNAGLLTMLERYDQLTQSIAKALEVSCNVTMALKVNTYSESEALKTKREEFENDIKANKSGILVTDLSSAIEKIPRDVKLVDAETLKFFYETILRANGTSLAILNGDYTKAQKEAYYEHALEADIKGLGQAISRTIFTDREAAFGNEIVLYPNDITFMSMENKLTALQVGLPAGIFTKNEARALLGYAPIEGGDVMPRGYNEVDGTGASGDDNTTNEVTNNE